MTGPTGTAPPLEGNTILIKNEINRVFTPTLIILVASYSSTNLDWDFLSLREIKGFVRGFIAPHAWQSLVLALDNMGIKTKFHQTEERNAPTSLSTGFPAIDWLWSSPCFQILCELHVPFLPILIGLISISVYTPIREAFIEGCETPLDPVNCRYRLKRKHFLETEIWPPYSLTPV